MNIQKLSVILCCVTAMAGAGETVKVLVGPNILVSKDGNFPHVETMVAANPVDASNLIGGAMAFSMPGGGIQSKTYTSLDGGYNWKATTYPEQRKFGGHHPQVAFGASGTALFTTLAFMRDKADQNRTALHLYRSEDRGINWSKPVTLGYDYNYQQIVVDHTSGKFSGHVYVGATFEKSGKVGVFRSEDDGFTFVGPVEVAEEPKGKSVKVTQLLVFDDGELFVPFWYTNIDGPLANTTAWFATSKDGGISFSKPSQVFSRTMSREAIPKGRMNGNPMYAIDKSTGPRQNQLYVVWEDIYNGRVRIMFSRSNDRGTTWSEAKLLDAKVSSGDQYQQMLTVNNKGVLGITWFDTRDEQNETHYNQYFSASIDGGKTFTDPVRISSKTSVPIAEGNKAVMAMEFQLHGTVAPNLLSAAILYPDGGDYMGLTADTEGVFHPLWVDSRSGTFQIWSAPVRVQSTKDGMTSAGNNAKDSKKHIVAAVTSRVKLVFDATHYDSNNSVLSIPVRIQNVSSQAIYGPITIEATVDQERIERKKAFGAEIQPLEILNATNGKSHNGAVFDYSNAMGDFDVLEPGAQTNALVWQLKVADPLVLPEFRFTVKGQLQFSKGPGDL